MFYMAKRMMFSKYITVPRSCINLCSRFTGEGRIEFLLKRRQFLLKSNCSALPSLDGQYHVTVHRIAAASTHFCLFRDNEQTAAPPLYSKSYSTVTSTDLKPRIQTAVSSAATGVDLVEQGEAQPPRRPDEPSQTANSTPLRLETKEEIPVKVMAAIAGNPKDPVSPSQQPEAALSADRFEVTACRVDEMQTGEMRHIAVPGQKQQVLLGKGFDGKYFAMGTACSHYSAFLKNGVLSDNRIRCPWHGACFSTKTGDIEEFPCVDGVHIFEVDIKGDDIVIKGEAKNVDDQKRTFPMCKHNRDSTEAVVIIGGGAAGLICAETLRKENFSGRIVIITEEQHPPYDRPKLSKALDSDISKILLRKEDFLREHDIEMKRSTKVEAIDFENKNVTLSGKIHEKIQYTKLVIAVGQCVRKLPVAVTGKAWKNIHYIRNLDDAKALHEAAKGKKIAILGSSFIGMEVAAYFADKASSITVISRTRVPYLAAFGEEVGEALKTELFDKKGVTFVPDTSIEAYEGDNDTEILQTVRLSDDSTVELDVLLAGIGTLPNTDFIRDTCLSLNPKSKALIVDEYMATNVPDVYGAGDCIEFPLSMYDNVRCTIGHWNIAHSQGKTAALSIVGKRVPLHSVPYFWTVIFTKSVRFAGYAHGVDETFIHGSLNGLKFVAYYLKNDRVVAAASLMYDPVVSRFAELIAKGAVITKDTILEDPELTKTADKVFSLSR